MEGVSSTLASTLLSLRTVCYRYCFFPKTPGNMKIHKMCIEKLQILDLWLLNYSSQFGIWIKLGRRDDQYVALNSAWSCYLVLQMRNTHPQFHATVVMCCEVLISMDVFKEISLLVVFRLLLKISPLYFSQELIHFT